MTPGVQEVTDPADPRLHDYTGLTDVALRRRREPAEGMFIAEGDKVIRRAIAAGYPLRSVLGSRRWTEALAAEADLSAVPVLVGDDALLEQVTGFQVHRGALAAMGRLPLPDASAVLASAERVLVVEDVVNHTNLGAIFRSVAGVGFDGVLLSPTCADPLYRRSVRVSMGSVFSVPYARLQSWPADLSLLREAGMHVIALTPDPAATPLADLGADVRARCALVLGTEGDGLTDPTLRAADVRARIPMAHGVDSLNVAAAAAVACYAIVHG
jgi:tRNA G18 (ribose-2'-O)-methylase SpoU